MGMFDTLYISHEKLGLDESEKKDLSGESFQTKDFDCSMTEVYITDDGFLEINEWTYESVPKEERPYPNDEGILGIVGSLKRTGEHLVRIPMHGYVNFYTSGKSGRWYEFNAKFTDGKLIEVTKHVSNE